LLAFGIIGIFTAIMNFFSNSLWSKSARSRVCASLRWWNAYISCIVFYILNAKNMT
jgi:hypothetical protein